MREFDARVIQRGDQFDSGAMTVIGHIGSKVEYGIHRIQQIAVPVVFQNAPTTFDGIVLAVVRRIIGQVEGEMIALGKVQEAGHKLRTPTVVLGAIIQIEDQGIDMSKALMHTQPPALQTVHQAIGGDFGCHHMQKQVVKLGEKNPNWRDGSVWLEVVIGGFDVDPAFPPREKGPILTVALASIERRSTCLAASAA